ncbi:MAG: RNA polymerase sigma factor RpoH [Candidatus Pelagibacter sp.]|nr:RNA polymerase sigma factor RpoH [Candidatus Pelagibacter sp.]|tara:strand:+ start:4273 stop:5172 length:900 start_codon:yes stop_codon:yes gene_type:complete
MNTKTEITNLPILSGEGGLSLYLSQIKKFPMLDAEEEYMLAKNWKERGNLKSAHKLVTSHLRLVAKIAMGYRGYGLPVSELISEGNIGLMQAVKKFNPDKGFRLATYAMWWIKAAMQEYVLRSWSLVKMGTTAAQKKLFFNLKKIKKQIAPTQEGDLRKDQVKEISDRLNVKSEEVISMNRRMMGQEKSLNEPIKSGEKDEWQDWVVDESLDQELYVSQKQEMDEKKLLLNEAIKILNDREKKILEARKLSNNPKTLDELSKKFKISRERIRQIETKAFEKLQKTMLNSSKSKNLLTKN